MGPQRYHLLVATAASFTAPAAANPYASFTQKDAKKQHIDYSKVKKPRAYNVEGEFSGVGDIGGPIRDRKEVEEGIEKMRKETGWWEERKAQMLLQDRAV